MKQEILQLYLAAPLIYPKTRVNAFTLPEEAGEKTEMLFCFEINPDQAEKFEPSEENFLGKLVFSGCTAANGKTTVELPSGDYIFLQERELLPLAAMVQMAVEAQKEGLWRRLTPGKNLYFRYLSEDDRHVSQVFRPYVAS